MTVPTAPVPASDGAGAHCRLADDGADALDSAATAGVIDYSLRRRRPSRPDAAPIGRHGALKSPACTS